VLGGKRLQKRLLLAGLELVLISDSGDAPQMPGFGVFEGHQPQIGKNVDSILGRRNIFGDKIHDAVSFEPEPTKNFKAALPTKLNALADPCR
jgi:hypothetical protein